MGCTRVTWLSHHAETQTVQDDKMSAVLAEREAFLHEIMDSTESCPELAAEEAKFAVVQEKSGDEELFAEVS